MTEAEELELLELEAEASKSQPMPPAQKPTGPPPKLGAPPALKGIQDLPTYGFGDEAGGGLQAGLAFLAKHAPGLAQRIGIETNYPEGLPTPGEAYAKGRDENRAESKQASSEHPWAYYGAGLGASLPAAAVTTPLGIAGDAALATKVIGGGVNGILQGGLAGAGTSEANNAGDIAKDAGISALAGGALGAGLPKLGSIVKPYAQKALSPISDAFERHARMKAVKAAGAMLKDYRALMNRPDAPEEIRALSSLPDDQLLAKIQTLGKDLLDSGVVRFGDKAEDVAMRAGAQRAQVGDEIRKQIQSFDDIARGQFAPAPPRVVPNLERPVTPYPATPESPIDYGALGPPQIFGRAEGSSISEFPTEYGALGPPNVQPRSFPTSEAPATMPAPQELEQRFREILPKPSALAARLDSELVDPTRLALGKQADAAKVRQVSNQLREISKLPDATAPMSQYGGAPRKDWMTIGELTGQLQNLDDSIRDWNKAASPGVEGLRQARGILNQERRGAVKELTRLAGKPEEYLKYLENNQRFGSLSAVEQMAQDRALRQAANHGFALPDAISAAPALGYGLATGNPWPVLGGAALGMGSKIARERYPAAAAVTARAMSQALKLAGSDAPAASRLLAPSEAELLANFLRGEGRAATQTPAVADAEEERKKKAMAQVLKESRR